MPRFELNEIKREGVNILLDQYKKMVSAGTQKAKVTEFEQAVQTLYELLLYRETSKMTEQDAALIEAAAIGHREPEPEPEPPPE